MNILVSRNGERYGPYDLDQVREGLEEGWLGQEDLIWHEAMPDWRRLDEVFEVNRSTSRNLDPDNYPKASPVAPFAAEPASVLPARTQVLKKKAVPARVPSLPAGRSEPAADPVLDPGSSKRGEIPVKWLVALSVLAGAVLLLGGGVAFWPGLKTELARVLALPR